MVNKKLLLLPCSKTKNNLQDVPAIDIYNGPFYKILRKYKFPTLDTYIISAKYGLISENDIISYYDEKLTKEKAIILSKQISNNLIEILKENIYDEIYINLGETYLLTIVASSEELNKYNTHYAHGQIGERLHQLKSWLTNNSNY